MSGDQALVGEKIEPVPDRDPPDAKFIDERIKCGKPVTGLPFAA
jgi:hypothetical protein